MAMQGDPPLEANIDPGQRVMALSLTLSISAFIVVILRLWIRIKDHNLGADDFCAFLASISFIGLGGVASYGAIRGLYRPSYYLDESQLENSLLMNSIGADINSIAAALGKISIALLLIRIMGRTSLWRTWFLWTIIALTAIVAIIAVFFPLFICRDPQAVWNLAIQAKTKCWNVSVMADQAIAFSAWFVAVDFILALFPLLMICDLQMSLRRKLVLSAFLGLGVVTGIIAALKTALLPAIATSSAGSFSQFELQVFVWVEVWSLIVLGCVPVFKRPGEYVFKRIYQSSLVAAFRRLVTRSSTSASKGNGPVSRQGYRRHSDASYALQHAAGANFAQARRMVEHSSAEDQSDLASHPEKKSLDEELEWNGIQVTHSFQVV